MSSHIRYGIRAIQLYKASPCVDGKNLPDPVTGAINTFVICGRNAFEVKTL